MQYTVKEVDVNSIVIPLALNGNMFAKCLVGSAGTIQEGAKVAKLLIGPKGSFITGSYFLMNGGTTAFYFYGLLKES